MACREGFEPPTHSLEGCCSIQLSYRQTRLKFIRWSGRDDSNIRPSAPKADALPGCATPRFRKNSYIIAQLLTKSSRDVILC